MSRIPLVIDTSAWVRHRRPSARPLWESAAEADLLVACPVATLEILRISRNEGEFEALDDNFRALRQATVTASVCDAALTASRELGARRRLPIADYLIAAAAAERGFGVLHADRHFDLLATVLPFENVRLPE
ncbi:MAG: PIN domain-containing protein [Solirubrobacterales bacterium]